MKQIAAVGFAFLLSGSLWALEVDRLFRIFAKGDAESLRIEVPAGDVKVQTRPSRAVEAELVLDCTGSLGPCRETAESIDFGVTREGATQILGFSGPARYGEQTRNRIRYVDRSFRTFGKEEGRQREKKKGKTKVGWRLAANMNLALPPYDHLELLVGDGSLSLNEVTGSTTIRIASGALGLAFERQNVSSLDVRVGSGSAVLEVLGGRTRRGKKLSWEGEPGAADVVVEIQRGTARITVH